MTATNEQIVALYENCQLTPEQIFEACDGAFTIEAIRLTLANGSAKYRKEQKQEDKLFTKDDAIVARTIIRQLAIGAENEGVKFKAAKTMLDEHFGRNDMNAIRAINGDINIINVQIKQAEEAIKKAKSVTIDINPEHKHLAEIAA